LKVRLDLHPTRGAEVCSGFGIDSRFFSANAEVVPLHDSAYQSLRIMLLTPPPMEEPMDMTMESVQTGGGDFAPQVV